MIISRTMNLDQLAERMGTEATEAEARTMRDLLVDFADDMPGVTITQDLTESQWLELLDKAAKS